MINRWPRRASVDAVNAIIDTARRTASSHPDRRDDLGQSHTPAPDPDLPIRTSGEMRVSNFLLWQIARRALHHHTPARLRPYRSAQSGSRFQNASRFGGLTRPRPRSAPSPRSNRSSSKRSAFRCDEACLTALVLIARSLYCNPRSAGWSLIVSLCACSATGGIAASPPDTASRSGTGGFRRRNQRCRRLRAIFSPSSSGISRHAERRVPRHCARIRCCSASSTFSTWGAILLAPSRLHHCRCAGDQPGRRYQRLLRRQKHRGTSSRRSARENVGGRGGVCRPSIALA